MNASTPKKKLITTQSAYGTAATAPATPVTIVHEERPAQEAIQVTIVHEERPAQEAIQVTLVHEERPAQEAIPFSYHTETVDARIRAYETAGINCLPAWGKRAPEHISQKAPAGKWTEVQTKRQTAADYKDVLRKLPDSIGVVCGTTSNIEALDFDHMKAYTDFLELAAKAGLGALIKRIAAGYTERSPKGVHWLYRLKLKTGQAFPGNQKWATKGKAPNAETLIETRGQGGYIVTAPSWGTYNQTQGSPASIITITSEEREQLRSLAAMLSENAPEQEPEKTKSPARQSTPATTGGHRPIDLYNEAHDWKEILPAAGWNLVFSRGEQTYWQRPNKKGPGCSGVSGPYKNGSRNTFTNFSSNAGNLPCGEALSLFDYFMHTKHAGNYNDAYAALLEMYPPPANPRAAKAITNTTATTASATKEQAKPSLLITVDEATVTAAALEILKDDLFLYNKAGRLVSPMILQKKARAKYKNKQQGRLSLVGVEPTFIRARLMERARLYREVFTKKGEVTEELSRCPEWLPNAIAATAINAELNPIRSIEGILAGPVIDENGDLQNNEGYCLVDDNGWYQAGKVEGLELHADLSQKTCKAMAKRLLDILCDFEFNDPTIDPVKWLACLLSQVSRQLYQNCPLFLFSANVGGAGKTHLAKAIGIICHGAECIAPEWPAAPEKREDEFGKANAGFAFSGTTLINYDNAPDGMILSSPVLENQLTAAYIEHRENHKHTTIGGRNWIQFSVTGNNIRPTVFLARRSIGISLQSTSANPSRIDPSGFTYGDFLSHIKKNRAELLKDALSIVAGYIKAGKPVQPGKHLACFEGWLQIPCSAARWATGADPLQDHEKLMADSDPTTQALEMLALGWNEAFPEGAVRSSRIFNLVTGTGQEPNTENIREAITIIVKAPLKNVNQIGPALQKFKGRVIEVDGMKHQLNITIDPHTKRSLFNLFKI